MLPSRLGELTASAAVSVGEPGCANAPTETTSATSATAATTAAQRTAPLRPPRAVLGLRLSTCLPCALRPWRTYTGRAKYRNTRRACAHVVRAKGRVSLAESRAKAGQERRVGQRREHAPFVAEPDGDGAFRLDLGDALSVSDERQRDVGCAVRHDDVAPARDDQRPREERVG